LVGIPSIALAQLPKAITVAGGMISGSTSGTVSIYKGIPFAAPPVGLLRWTAPQPPQPWKGVRKCTAFGPSPMQGTPEPFSMWTEEFLIPKQPISEDCLYLNVWTPAKKQAEKLPVLVWIYGGGFMSGGSAVPIYDGEALAKKGIIVVSFNYRVGIFGFLAHWELEKEGKGAGNYGLMDQIMALQWVKDNISKFGGDPGNVTVAGQSAGSVSVNCLVNSQQAKGLFTKAIAESGSAFFKNFSRQEALALAHNAQISLKCKNVAEMRAIPAESLLYTYQQYGPSADGYILPLPESNSPSNTITLLTGWNQDEGFSWPPLSASQFEDELKRTFDDDAKFVINNYPSSNPLSQLYFSRDRLFGLGNYEWANRQAKIGTAYVYRFMRKVPATDDYVKYGAFHTGEVPYVFNNLRLVDRPWEVSDHELADAMSDYWVNFVKTGNPNGPGLPEWKAYSEPQNDIMKFNLKPEAGIMVDTDPLESLKRRLEGK